MIWRPSSHTTIAKLADFSTSLLGFWVSYIVWQYLYNEHLFRFIPEPIALSANVIAAVLLFSIYVVYVLDKQKAYSYQRFTSLLTEYIVVLKTTFILLLTMVFIAYMSGEKSLPRTMFILSIIFLTLFLIIEKSLLFYIAGYIRKRGYNLKRTIIIGTGTRAKQIIETVKKNPAWGIKIIGFLTGEKENVGKTAYGYDIIDSYDNIIKVIKQYNPEEIIISISTKRFDKLREVLEACELVGIKIRLNSDFFGHIVKNVDVDRIYDMNIISLNFNRQTGWQAILKRIIDIFLSLLLIIILSPVLITIALLIYIQDGRPVLYDWHIVGFNRKPIKSWKFRTMVKNADEIKKQLMKENEMSGPVFKMTNDPRILPIGRFLRKYSLDEFPQLFSVLKGDLSLVGPRPPLQYEFDEFDLWHRRKLSVKPGITCLWQISGRSEITNFDEWAKLDLEYIDNWSLLLDFMILLKTIPVVLLGKGAK